MIRKSLNKIKTRIGHRSFADQAKIVVAMSGGVDSSVAAYLLQNMSDASVKVSGLHMSNWNALDEDYSDVGHRDVGSKRRRGRASSQSKVSSDAAARSHQRPSNSIFCEASEKDYLDSQSVARHLSIPLHRVSFASEYWVHVFEPFVESLASPTLISCKQEDQTDITCGGTTMPNPDFGCNAFIKFGAMKDYAMNELDADFVATGHYAQLWHRGLDYSGNNNNTLHSSPFFEWIKESSRKLERQVHEAVSGRPEEDWLLSSNSQLRNSNSHCPMLLAGADRSKDQTYFLSGVQTDKFRNVIFPLGHLAKKNTTPLDKPNNNDHCIGTEHQQSVRDIALQAKLPTAMKKDSMGICFIGKRNFGQFVSQYLPDHPECGPFVDVDTGVILGYHQGSIHFTIGQGAKISGASTKYFVCGKGSRKNDNATTVFVCNDTHHPSLYTDELFVEFQSLNWIGIGRNDSNGNRFLHVPTPLVEGQTIELLARIRHLQPLVPCSVSWQRHSHCSVGVVHVKFHKPMRAITPGQILALYAGNGLICLGGGPIHMVGQSFMERGLDVTLSMLHPSGCNDLSLIS